MSPHEACRLRRCAFCFSLTEDVRWKTVTMGLSPVELIISRKVEADLPHISSQTSRAAGPLRLFGRDFEQVGAPFWSAKISVCDPMFLLWRSCRKPFRTPQEDAESAGRRHGRAHHRFLQLLRKRRRQAQTQQRRAEGAPAQRAHRLPHGNVRASVFPKSSGAGFRFGLPSKVKLDDAVFKWFSSLTLREEIDFSLICIRRSERNCS